MKKIRKTNQFVLVAKDEETDVILSSIKNNQKLYNRLIDGLKLLGNFLGPTVVEIFDTLTTKNNKKIRLYCFDVDNNLFVFYGESSDKKDMLKLSKENNFERIDYDLSIAKRFELSSENIGFTRIGNIYGLKFGRLITDWKNFYNIYLRDDIGYQIQGDFSSPIGKEIINRINKLDKTPKLADCISIFESIINENQIEFSKINIQVFKKFELIGNFTIDNKFEKGYSPRLKKTEE